MEELINKYLAYLRVERNSSEHTLLAYKKDLLQLLHFVADESGVDPADVDAEDIERLTIRLWMGGTAPKRNFPQQYRQKNNRYTLFFQILL